MVRKLHGLYNVQRKNENDCVCINVKINLVRSVDRKKMAALVETGITWKDLELELSPYGIVCSHETDSEAFSMLSGWISIKASDLKPRWCGNIVLSIKGGNTNWSYNKV